MKKTPLSLLFFLVFNVFTLIAQSEYPKGYFINPLGKGVPISLSGGFGDIRINHFHSGLDIRTGGVEGKRVVAAADGYVSRIRVQLGGYGNALYITHPNGFTTVYAHLKEFNNEIAKYLIQKQYEQKTWTIDVEVPKDLMPYKQGDFVALSGNTGGSAGPHLHFEIRDAVENTLDPELFGFSEIKDFTLPLIDVVTLKTVSSDALINGKFGSFNFKPILKGQDYTIPNVKATGMMAIELLTYDKSGNSPFRLGIHSIEVRNNGELAFKYTLNKMSFNNKEDMNIHVNYEKQIQDNLKIHKAYVEEANGFDFYESNENWGKILIDKPTHHITVKVGDTKGNFRQLSFTVTKDNAALTNEVAGPTKATISDNYLKINTNLDVKNATIKTINGKEEFPPLKKSGLGGGTIIYNLEKGFPETVYLENEEVALPVNTAITLRNPFFKKENLSGNFENALYSDIFIYTQVSDQKLVLHKDVIPLKGYASLKWTKTEPVNYPEKLRVYLDGKKPKFIGGNWQGNTITFSTRELGTYVTLYDFDPPKITPVSINKDQLRFNISDNLSGIKKIECYVDNEWVLMDFEYKTGAIWSRKSDNSKPFSGNIVLKVTDNCNNTQSYESNL